MPEPRAFGDNTRMHFVDLTPYTYSQWVGYPPALNVGWLDIEMPFERGPVPAGFIERLRKLVSQQEHLQTLGFQVCQFCKDLHAALRVGGKFDQKLYNECLADGRFSSAEIRVSGKDGRWYASPRMIAHYVEVHGYKPPDEFIEAVMKDDE